jgi:ribosomal protein L7/L12
MSPRVRFLGWSRGLNKVELTKLIRGTAGMPLNEAHDVVNRLLTGEVVEVEVSSVESAQELADAAHALGAQTECVQAQMRTETHD